MIINAISGFSASSRKQSDTLAGFLDSIPLGEYLMHNSANRGCVYDSLWCLSHLSKDQTLVLIGKSLGAVRTWWLAYNHWDKIKHFKKIRVILIDPHGWQRGDGRWGSYGRKMLNGKWRNLRTNNKWLMHPDFKIVDVYQEDSFPRGAGIEIDKDSSYLAVAEWERRVLTGKVNIKLPPGANHWNCTDIMSDTGEFVAGVILDIVEGLE